MEIIYFFIALAILIIGDLFLTIRNKRLLRKARNDAEMFEAFLALVTGAPVWNSGIALMNISEEYRISSNPPSIKHPVAESYGRAVWDLHYDNNSDRSFSNMQLTAYIRIGDKFYSKTIYGHMFPKPIISYMNFADGRSESMYPAMLNNLATRLSAYLEQQLFEIAAATTQETRSTYPAAPPPPKRKGARYENGINVDAEV